MNQALYLVALVSLPMLMAQKLERNPAKEIIKLGDHGHGGLRLKCTLNFTNPEQEKDDSSQVEWWNIMDDGQESRVEEKFVKVMEGTATSVLKMGDKDVVPGVYECRASGQSHRWTVYFFQLKPFEKSQNAIADEDVILRCELTKNSNNEGSLVFQWFKVSEDDPMSDGELMTNSTTNSGDIDPHIRIGIPQQNMSYLKIEDALYEDRSIYRCKAELTRDGETLNSSTQTLIRIKDKYSALYPFIGILAEVIALALIIFICERRKSSEGIDEDDEDYHGGVSAGNGNSNLRHRRS